MKSKVRELIEQGDKLFSNRSGLLGLWQTIADNFYPERADFLAKFTFGTEFASHLMSGRPVMARRDLANSLSAMLRPGGQQWFRARTDDEKVNNNASALQWLDRSSDVLRRVMYERRSQFMRATKEGDNDFAAFGQCVIEVKPNRDYDGLLYQCWHLRDVAWCENAELVIDVVHRNWMLEAREMVRLFPKTVSAEVKRLADKEPYRPIKCRHIVIPSTLYDYTPTGPYPVKRAFVSIYVDVENETVLEEVGVNGIDYVIPRWVTLSGNQYAYSPAATIALPDARMLQAIGLTLLEAGQKAVDPPMLAVGEVINGGVNAMAGGVTFVDSDYDERTGEALRPLPIDTRGLNWGVERETKCEAMIMEAFYLNKINLPDFSNGDHTAYQIQQMVKEYIRQATPLFEPMQTEYNGGICEKSFEHLLRMNAFGGPNDLPQMLRGQNVRFQFDSPLQDATERAKSQAFMEAGQLLTTAMQLDQTVIHDVDIDTAFRQAFTGTGAPSDWLVDEDVAAKAKAAARQAQAQIVQQQASVAAAGQMAEVAKTAGEAKQAIQGAQGVPA